MFHVIGECEQNTSRALVTFKPLTALSIGNQTAKFKTTTLVSTNDFMIIFFRKEPNINPSLYGGGGGGGASLPIQAVF